MDLGLMLTDAPSTRSAADQFSDAQRLVAAAQEAGFRYVAIGQHFLYGSLRWLQPIPLLARLAADTDPDVRLATNIMIAPLYHPVLLAEEIATLDVITGGRFVFGAGIGYRQEEFDALGVPKKERGARMDELLELLPLLWNEEEVTFEGRFWQLEGARPHLRPIQRPAPTTWIGGVAIAGARRAGRYGDGYIANPEADATALAERYAAVAEGFAVRGKAFIPQPLRRNVMLGDSYDQALDTYVEYSQARYQTYAGTGLGLFGDDELGDNFRDTVARHAIFGTPEDIIRQMTWYANHLPVDPLIVRLQWPHLSLDQVLEQIGVLGREVVPALRDVQPAAAVSLRSE